MNFNLKKVEKHTHPFPYAIIENPFEEAENIERDFPSMDNVKSSLRMDKDITYPSEIYLNLLSESAVYAKVHNTIIHLMLFQKSSIYFKMKSKSICTTKNC